MPNDLEYKITGKEQQLLSASYQMIYSLQHANELDTHHYVTVVAKQSKQCSIFFARVNDLLRVYLYDFRHNNKNNAGIMTDWRKLTEDEKYQALMQSDLDEPMEEHHLASRKLETEVGISYRQQRIIGDFSGIDSLDKFKHYDAFECHFAKDENIARLQNLQTNTGMTAQEITAILKGARLDINESVKGLASDQAIEGFITLDEELGLGKKFVSTVLRGAGKDTAEAVNALLDESTQQNLEDVIAATNIKPEFLSAVLKESGIDIAEDVQVLADRKPKIRELLSKESVSQKVLASQIKSARDQGQSLSDAIDGLHAGLGSGFQERLLAEKPTSKER